MIRAGTGVSRLQEGVKAAEEAVEQALSRAGIDKADLLLVFGTSHYGREYPLILKEIIDRSGSDQVAGCTGVGVLTDEGEVESGRALTVMAVSAQNMVAKAFLEGVGHGREDEIGRNLAKVFAGLSGKRLLLLFPDPYTCNTSKLIESFPLDAGGFPIVGAGSGESGNLGASLQFCGPRVEASSVSGLMLSGGFRFNIGVTQGCRPFAGPYTPTKVKGNMILELDGKQAVQVVADGVERLRVKSHGMARGPVFLGCSVADGVEPLESGGYLVRQIAGVDKTGGGVVIPEDASTIKRLSLVCLDPDGATEDMYKMLEESKKAIQKPAFGIYFDCCGRGTNLYRFPNCDVNAIREYFGDLPVIGFHGNFELAPSYGRNMLHTYTGVLVLVSEGT